MADLLAAERQAVATQLADLDAELAAIMEVAAMAPPDDEHDPEGSTVGFERARVIALVEGARTRLADLDRAADRLRDGTFGRCRHCGAAIPTERLLARPAAGTCIGCASAPPPRLGRG